MWQENNTTLFEISADDDMWKLVNTLYGEGLESQQSDRANANSLCVHGLSLKKPPT